MNENALVVGVGLRSEPINEIKESLWETEELVYAAGANVIGSLTQILMQWNPGSLLGKGKVAEIADIVKETGANLVVVDHALSGVQQRNLEDAWATRVLDRNQLILDIFAKRARSHEGKLQVELAQLLDQAPRMVGAWLESHSRLGGGIGTRGPGEKALETDRRTMRFRVSQIRKELEEVKRHRRLHRERRKRNEVHRFALIGYTNTGKSTLFNRLTNSDVLVKDMPFATLDPTTRKVELDENKSALVTDTVGFIRKLPAQLIDAFEATLEESADAEVLIHVIDLSSAHRDPQIDTVMKLIEKFGWQNKPIIHVFNKTDKAAIQEQFKVKLHPKVFTSALNGDGIENLKKKMVEAINSLRTEVELFIPQDQEYQLYELAKQGEVLKKEKGTKGTICYVALDPQHLRQWHNYRVK
jgi:GTPase